jgi:polar amino acid transport system substrate-binding protein
MVALLSPVLILIVLLIQPCKAEEYHFAAISNLYEQEVGEIILTDVYRRAGLEMKVSRMPGQRAIMEAASGRVDGEIMRIWSYGIEHPQLVRVPTSYYFLETMAFYKKGSDAEVNSVEDLAKYSVLKVRGVKHTNAITKGLTKVYNYDNTEAMLRALDEDRNNVAITHRGDGIFAIQKHGLKNIDSSEFPMFSFPLYHYVFKEKRHLVDKIDRIILAMKATGELDILIRTAEKQVFEANGLVYQPPE